ncbi:MAG: radical SAM protein [Myxococcaceae bacterium]
MDHAPIHFDLEGRWTRAHFDGAMFLRGFDGVVLERFGADDGADLRIKDAAVVHARVVEWVRQSAEAPAAAREWDVDRLLGEAARFLVAYRPVGIVPPDRYRSVIVQATQGCGFNGCLFCSLYKGQRHRVVPVEEFREHVRRVKTFLGSNVVGRRGVFLGEANALAMPLASLVADFEVLRSELPELAHDVACFVDAFEAWRTVEELRQLRSLGLTRVFVGVESGDSAALAAIGKPASVAGVEALVASLKEAGLSVGVIFLAGLGEAHVEASVALVSRLGLAASDVIYVSPLVVEPASALGVALRARGMVRASAEIALEAEVMRQRLAGRSKVGRYDVRRWVYT